MLNGGEIRFRDVAISALDWWIEAGFDGFITENPRDWLAPVSRSAVTPIPTPGPSPVALPDDLAALHAFLATGDYAPGAAPPRLRVAPSGNPATDMMIVSDMPEQGDAEAGRLFAGETGRLFDAMLAAMGRSREDIYLAPLSPARLPGGRIGADTGETLATLMRRHAALAAPKALLLFGDEAARLLIGEQAVAMRGGLREFSHDRGAVPTIALVHPRHLRQYPALKAAAWKDMRLLLGMLAQ